jgi:2-polyprenyl-3-methyl-5-hydroxy-6-metoxy-1,4-benzoquinol methylase
MTQDLADRVRNKVRGLLLSKGTPGMKRSLWNSEFARGRWNNLARTHGDCLYPHLEKFANGGSILDLGCGLGNTGAELADTAYTHYTGVDISDVAIQMAKGQAEQDGRAAKNQYFQSDIVTYQPTQQFDVILFRESIYYVAGPPLKGILTRYAQFLKPDGVFMVRLWTGSGKYAGIVDFLEANYTIVEKHASESAGPVILVFR